MTQEIVEVAQRPIRIRNSRSSNPVPANANTPPTNADNPAPTNADPQPALSPASVFLAKIDSHLSKQEDERTKEYNDTRLGLYHDYNDELLYKAIWKVNDLQPTTAPHDLDPKPPIPHSYTQARSSPN